jgi:ferredoxin
MPTCTHIVVYSSPAGSTAHVAQVIMDELKVQGAEAQLFPLWQKNWITEPPAALTTGHNPICLWVGSPVYAHHPVPPVTEFLQSLPRGRGYGVPFVTWGAVTSGTALYDMGRALEDRDWQIIGAAKVVAVHSGLLESEHPLGQGHPDGADDEQVRDLVRHVIETLSGEKPLNVLESDHLNYQPEWVRERSGTLNLDVVKQSVHPGFEIDEQACTQCGVCSEACPSGAIELDPTPVMGPECILCHTCVRECPEEAIHVQGSIADKEKRLRSMSEEHGETPGTRIFT